MRKGAVIRLGWQMQYREFIFRDCILAQLPTGVLSSHVATCLLLQFGQRDCFALAIAFCEGNTVAQFNCYITVGPGLQFIAKPCINY